jgi:hypothetical protein
MPDDRRHGLAGLTARSQAIYVKSVRRLAAHYRRAPDELSEEEVRAYLVKLRDRGAAGEPSRSLITQFSSFTNTRSAGTGRCFLKQRFVCRSTNGYRTRWPTTRSAVCSVA